MTKTIIILICLLLSSYFSATETAFSTLNRVKIKAKADKGNKNAKLVLKLTDDFNSLLTTVLIGNNIVNILGASLATVLFTQRWGEPKGSLLSTIVMTIVVLVFGEISPKTIAKERPEAFACFSARIIYILKYLFYPLNYLFTLWKRLLSKIFKKKEEENMVEEEILTLVKEAEQEGDLEKSESDIIKSAVVFADLEVGDVFKPRIDVAAISVNAPVEEINKLFLETGYSRIPLYGDKFDDMIGILYYKDFYHYIYGKKEFDLRSVLKPIIYFTKSQKISDVLKEFQKQHLHFGLLLDEFGSVAGIITLEDIVEEIVGEIWDEHDRVEDEIVKKGENEYIVSGKTSIVKLFNLFDIDNEEDFLTVNGWAMDCLNGIPKNNAEFDYEGLHVKILKANPKRVETVLVVDNRDPEED